jgi:hypothetical protein
MPTVLLIPWALNIRIIYQQRIYSEPKFKIKTSALKIR